MKRILLAEGNIRESRERSKAICGFTQGERYADVLKGLAPELEVEVYNLPELGPPPRDKLVSFDGVVMTGSALQIYDDRPEVHRQIAFARDVFASGRPFFGSCWGLQVAAVAAGGEAGDNHRGREIGFSRRITLTDEGRNHPLHKGRISAFDAPAVHTVHVTRPAEGMIVTATNAVSEVQGAEIRYMNGVFWGVQYHPEFTIGDLADVMLRYAETVINEERLFRDQAELEYYVRDLRALHADRTRRDIAWRYALDSDLLDDHLRTREIANWLELQVGARVTAPSAEEQYVNYGRATPHGPEKNHRRGV